MRDTHHPGRVAACGSALDDIEGYVRRHFWKPEYLPFIKGDSRPF